MSEQDCTAPREGFPRPFPNTPANVLDQLSLTGKVVVVTGAADGLGYAVAEAMAEAKADVAMWYNSYGCTSFWRVNGGFGSHQLNAMIAMMLRLRKHRLWLRPMESRLLRIRWIVGVVEPFALR